MLGSRGGKGSRPLQPGWGFSTAATPDGNTCITPCQSLFLLRQIKPLGARRLLAFWVGTRSKPRRKKR